MLVNTTEDEWDAVIRVHLKGHFAPLRHAGAYWRAEAKAGRHACDARVINTTSGAGLQGCVGQGNYSAAKAGIAGLTLVAAAELGRYGVTVNAIAPAARTRMTETVFADMMADARRRLRRDGAGEHLAAGGLARQRRVRGRHRPGVRGRGRHHPVAEGWAHGPQVDKGARWDPAELGPVVDDLLAKARTPLPVYGA